jgi:hypothetical protein
MMTTEYISTSIKEKAFIDKWLADSVRKEIGEYWSSTPSLVYWVLIYAIVSGWDKYNMAEDLLDVYTDSPISNSSTKDALSVIASSR